MTFTRMIERETEKEIIEIDDVKEIMKPIKPPDNPDELWLGFKLYGLCGVPWFD